ncbi:MAG TPA: flagellar basal body-associated FliL family protein [Pseudobacteroides sp.]|uniref:flagellar basal body-associated FliL family protein n=1 Tax=Pseudobacteroides sp. TaxID=1968840 RepID=UPI002F9356B3
MGGKGSFFVLLIVVAFLSLSLAVLAIYVFVFGGNNSGKETKVVETVTVTTPKDSELAEMALFEGDKIFNLKSSPSSEEKSLAAIRVSIKLKYFIKVEGIKDVAVKLKAYESEMRELVGNYFLNMSVDEVSKPETKEKTKKELKQQINHLLLESEIIKTDLVYSVVLEDWFYQ